MLGYQLFYHVKCSKKSDYSETKFFAFEKEAREEAFKLCACSNVDFVSIRYVEVQSIDLTVFKKSDTVEIYEPYLDLTPPKLDFKKIDIPDLNINTVSNFQHDNPPTIACKTFNELIKDNFNAK